MRFDKKTIRYLIISGLSIVLWQFGLLLRKTSFGNAVIIRQILDIFPNLILCIMIPFLLLGIIRVFRVPKKETSLLYYFVFALLIASVVAEYGVEKWVGTDFDIFDIIASCIGLFGTMVIHDRLEIKMKQGTEQ